MSRAKKTVTNKPAYCSLIASDDMRLDGLYFGQSTPLKTTRVAGLFYGRDNPITVEADIQKARYWFERNAYIRQILLLRLAFYNSGLTFKKDPAVDKWLDATRGKKKTPNREAARKLIAAGLLEWLICDNVVAVWMASNKTPTLLCPEHCSFADLFGKEMLTLKLRELGIDKDAIKKLPGLKAAEIEALAKDDLTLTEDNVAFGFEVLKRSNPGMGFSRPGLTTMLSACAFNESMEVRDTLLGGLMRNVIEHHKLGSEIKQGPMAGSKANFANDKWVAAVQKLLANKLGFFRLITRHDHDIKYPAPDFKEFDRRKYESVQIRMDWWSMPLGQAIFGKGFNPQLMNILKAQAQQERADVKPFLRNVLVRGLGAPENIDFTWSNKVFHDARLANDLLKFALTTGPLSQKTFLDEMELEQKSEQELKTAEAAQPEGATHPLGRNAGGFNGKGKIAGRNSGTKDEPGGPKPPRQK